MQTTRPAATAARTLLRSANRKSGAVLSRFAPRPCFGVFQASFKSSPSLLFNNSIDETWQDRRAVMKADDWASSIPEKVNFQSSIDETWQQRREVASADSWASKH